MGLAYACGFEATASFSNCLRELKGFFALPEQEMWLRETEGRDLVLQSRQSLSCFVTTSPKKIGSGPPGHWLQIGQPRNEEVGMKWVSERNESRLAETGSLSGALSQRPRHTVIAARMPIGESGPRRGPRMKHQNHTRTYLGSKQVRAEMA